MSQEAASKQHWMSDEEHSRVRATAFVAVVVSTVAVVSAIVTLPLLYSYVHQLHAHYHAEMSLCQEHSCVRATAFAAIVVSTVATVSAIVTLPLLCSYVHQLHAHYHVEMSLCESQEATSTQQWTSEQQHSRLRATAFMAVVVSTVAVFSAIVTLPLLYSYVHQLHANYHGEMSLCQTTLLNVNQRESRMSEEEHSRVRATAFIAVVVSTVAVVSAIVTLPLIYNYVHQLHVHYHAEMSLCQIRSRDIVGEIEKRRTTTEIDPSDSTLHSKFDNRAKRSTWLFGQFYQPSSGGGGNTGTILPMPSGGFGSMAACGTCTCHQGPAGSSGPPGNPGDEGSDGEKGAAGREGNPGRVLAPDPAEPPCMKCPTGPPGPRGPAGPKGKRGARGDLGMGGMPGKQGTMGPPGGEGPEGDLGGKGEKGPLGSPGVTVLNEDAQPGFPGPPGSPGMQGKPGIPGPNGQIGGFGTMGRQGSKGPKGGPGRSGRPGLKGESGEPGQKGQCDHCAPPRTSPGY